MRSASSSGMSSFTARTSMAAIAALPSANFARCPSSCRLQSLPTFSLRMSGASDSPCTTSVTAITTKVRKMMRSRCGNGASFSMVIGSASAAASDTIPRMPHQLIQRMRQISRWVDPGEPDCDRHGADERAVQHELPRRVAGEPSDDARELYADQDEHQAVQQEHEQVPH